MPRKKPSVVKTVPECIVILHDIRSVINVGAIFRTADAVGVSKIIISGVTPGPLDRFGRKRSDFTKSALGAEHSVPWEQVKSVVTVIKNLKKQGFTVYVLEQDKKSIDYKSVQIKNNDKIVIIPGNEVSGAPKSICNLADHIIEIPMHGTKESLNVSVATGILLYRLLDQ